jgi:glutaminyl-tRNA synthetase
LENLPGVEARGTRKVPFSRELWIEQDDFMEHPAKNYYRLTTGGAVRLKGAYIILCEQIVKDERGHVTALLCKYFPETRSGHQRHNIKVKSTIHWLSVPFAVSAEIRLYNRLFSVEDPGQTGNDFINHFNEDSIQVLPNAYIENDLATENQSDVHYQFIRLGYFIKEKNSKPCHLIFNRTVDLKEHWKKT